MSTSTKQLKFRGVIEGFYGPRWTHADRLSLLDRMPKWNMNLYIYSARNDPYHRFGWSALYPREEMRRFEELAARAAESKVVFSIAISPGNTFDPSKKEHRRLLMRKLQQFCGLGCRLFPIFYDDLTAPVDFNGSSGVAHAEKQASVMNYFLETLMERMPQTRVLCCPTEYGTAEKSAYLSRLHELLDRRVEVMCTSVDEPDPKASPRAHCPRTWAMEFSNAGARRYFQNFGRKPFLWDNFNCADFVLNQLNWSPYRGRGDRLNELCSGIVLNPQHVAMMNWPVFGTVGEYFANPRRYNPRRAMNRSLEVNLGKRGAAIGRTLSKWYTTEWSGYNSSDANLPDLDCSFRICDAEASHLSVGTDRRAVREAKKSGGSGGPALPVELRATPALGKNLRGTNAQQRNILRQVKLAVAPLLSLDDRFNTTLMPADWACHLSGYVNLLKWWSCAINALCDAALKHTPVARDQARSARKTIEDLRRYSYRMPESLLDYLEKMVDELTE